jgi:hypothetical protein
MSDLALLSKGFNIVRDELFDLGFLKNTGKGLDSISLVETLLPNWLTGGDGFFYHAGVPRLHELVGFEEATIYVAPNTNHGIKDVIRHEFGHALAWVKETHFEKAWFERAFGGDYFDEAGEASEWMRHYYGDDSRFLNCLLSDEYISPYAMTNPSEDLAECFMFYLKYKGDISRFRARPGVYKKLLAIKKLS